VSRKDGCRGGWRIHPGISSAQVTIGSTASTNPHPKQSLELLLGLSFVGGRKLWMSTGWFSLALRVVPAATPGASAFTFGWRKQLQVHTDTPRQLGQKVAIKLLKCIINSCVV